MSSSSPTPDSGSPPGAAPSTSGIGDWLRKQWETNPIEIATKLIGLLAALGGGFYFLGLRVHRARESLLHISALRYSKPELVWTGVDVPLAVLWNSVTTPLSSHPMLGQSAVTLLIWTVVGLWGIPWQERRWRWVRDVWVVLTVPLLFVGISLYMIALRASHPEAVFSPEGALCSNQLSNPATSSEQVAYESCSWLTNDGARNDERRQSLGGLWGWLLLAVGSTLWTAWGGLRGQGLRGQGWQRRGRLGLVWVHAGLLLWLLWQLPLAHAYGAWGLKYPAVAITGTCDEALSAAMAAGTCCGFDVSAGAETPALLLRGSGCPRRGLWRWGKEDEKCQRTELGRRVVVQGCG